MKKMLNIKVSKSANPEITESEKQVCNEIVTEGDHTKQVNGDLVPNLNPIMNTLHELSTSAIKSNITITDSSNVHLGHTINYDGNLYLNLVNNNNEPGISLIQQHDNNNGVLIKTVSNIHISNFPIIQRSVWSVRKPNEEYDKIEEPVRLVIISHTATASSASQSKNIQLIRDIQSFHVDTHNWNDIGYNFLIAGDGTIYEGRGWGIEGAHTFGYNNRSIGVSFIGCFINRKPTEEALNACKNLLERGINEGHLAKNYKLLGHRQCTETESPGTKLYDEITTWDHFYNKSIDEYLEADDKSSV